MRTVQQQRGAGSARAQEHPSQEHPSRQPSPAHEQRSQEQRSQEQRSQQRHQARHARIWRLTEFYGYTMPDAIEAERLERQEAALERLQERQGLGDADAQALGAIAARIDALAYDAAERLHRQAAAELEQTHRRHALDRRESAHQTAPAGGIA